MNTLVKDRRLALAAVGAVLALAAGVVGVVTGRPVWAVIAGVLGFATGCAAAALAAQARIADEQVVRANAELAQVRRDLETLRNVLAEEHADDDATPAITSVAAAESSADAASAKSSDGKSSDGNVDAEVEPPGDRVDVSGVDVAGVDDAAVAAEARKVFDERSGLLDEKFFAVNVQQRVAAARRQLQPVSIVLFELDGLSERDTDLRDQAMTILGDVLRRTLRECDSACRIGEAMAAAVLEDTTEAGAVWAAERVRGSLHSSPIGNQLTVSAGVACYPSHALDAPDLVAMAGRALEIARGRGRDQVEIAPNAD